MRFSSGAMALTVLGWTPGLRQIVTGRLLSHGCSFTARAVSLFSDLWACPPRRIPVQRVGGRVDRAVFPFSEPGEALSAAREMFFVPWACLSSCISAYFVRRCVEPVRDSPVASVPMFSAPYSLCRGGRRLATAIWFLSALWARFQRAGASCRARAGLFAGVFYFFVSCGSAGITLVVLAFLPMIERRFEHRGDDMDVTPLETVCERASEPIPATLTDDTPTDAPRPAEREDR